jgi:hypothetical protein
LRFEVELMLRVEEEMRFEVEELRFELKSGGLSSGV